MKNNIIIKKNKSKFKAKFYYNNISGTCQVGYSGIGKKIKEGDGVTPVGIYDLLEIYYRKDKVKKIYSLKDCIEITKKSGWSTESTDTNYNKYVTLPYNKSHEKLHRSDACYDLIITTNFNSSPARKYKGSAIFVHCTDSSKFTDGCVAIPKNQLLCIIRSLKKNSKIVITY